MTTPHHTTGFARRLLQVFAGAVLMGIGLALLVRARLGILPLDVLHAALASLGGWSLGQAIIGTQLALLLIWWVLKIQPGIGTLLGVVVPALTVDLALQVLPAPSGLLVRAALLALGGVLFAAGTALYLSAHLGAIPRDGLIDYLHQRGHSLAGVRVAMDVVCLVAGWLVLGPLTALHAGAVGIGSILLALLLGLLVAWFLRCCQRIPFIHNGRPALRVVDDPSEDAMSEKRNSPARRADRGRPRAASRTGRHRAANVRRTRPADSSDETTTP